MKRRTKLDHQVSESLYVPVRRPYARPVCNPVWPALLRANELRPLELAISEQTRAKSELHLALLEDMDLDHVALVERFITVNSSVNDILLRLRDVARERARLSTPPWTMESRSLCCKAVRSVVWTLTALRTLGLVAGLHSLPLEMLYLIFWFL